MLFKKLTNAIRRFSREKRASMALAHMLTIPIVGATSAAVIDMNDGYNARSEIQLILDRAALAASRDPDAPHGKVLAHGRKLLRNALKSAGIEKKTRSYTANFEFDENRETLIATFSGEVKTWMGTMTGVPKITVNVRSEVKVSREAAPPLEIALVLDTSGSMGGSRISALRTAVNQMLDGLFAADDGAGKVRVSLVPYASYVRIDGYSRFSAYSYSSLCPSPRTGGGRDKDTPSRYEKFYGSSSCGYRYPIMPLSSDKTTLKRYVSTLNAGGGTNGSLGFEWGWYAVSGNWRDEWNGSAKPNAYGDADKVVVMMTDGVFGDLQRFQSLCKNARNAGVKVYSIAFQAPASSAAQLRACAGGGDNFFQPNSASQLVSAFAAIGERATAPRLSR